MIKKAFRLYSGSSTYLTIIGIRFILKANIASYHSLFDVSFHCLFLSIHYPPHFFSKKCDNGYYIDDKPKQKRSLRRNIAMLVINWLNNLNNSIVIQILCHCITWILSMFNGSALDETLMSAFLAVLSNSSNNHFSMNPPSISWLIFLLNLSVYILSFCSAKAILNGKKHSFMICMLLTPYL